MNRSIPYTLHAAIEMLGGAAVMALPFVLGLGEAATVASVVVGALLITMAVEVTGSRRSIPLSAHAGFDYTLAFAGAVAGITIGLATGEWRATIFLVGVGAAQVALTASTRWSSPAGA
jgi:hypothetical protein